jgi:hypothetical protein
MQLKVLFVRGLKGTISEVELYQIKARMVRGRLNKAQRGELIWNVPIGLVYDALTGDPNIFTRQNPRPFQIEGKLIAWLNPTVEWSPTARYVRVHQKFHV